ncbi:MAG: DUF2974 domain-containing protein [Clostridia bacterium]|nr:DUF2974 domain-containing protein [Clostridia bacterium]
MNIIDRQLLEKANEEASYNLYIYLAHMTSVQKGETLEEIVSKLEQIDMTSERNKYRLQILRNTIDQNTILSQSTISNLTLNKGGLTACSFTKPNGGVSVIFRGTGSGEWIDNGEGLSGIPEENTYITYDRFGQEKRTIIKKDYATDQQTEALNWFNRIAAENAWRNNSITVSGHSKGGNKAQFIAIHSDLVKDCFSFDGQGFSPEALKLLKERHGDKYYERREKIMSLSACNDYVNVLGERIMPEDNIYYFESFAGFHYLEAMLDRNGVLRPQCRQGKLSQYIETVSAALMNMKPIIRQNAALGIMNIFQKYLGEGTPVNSDNVSLEKTVAGLGIAIGSILHSFRSFKDM